MAEATVVEFANDPYLAYQPSFAYTLPVQLIVAGVTLTLLVVLLIHLLFTTQYHYPLAPLNYCLQLSAIVSCLASVIIKIIVILNHSSDNAGLWPYDLDYIAVSIPSDTWSIGSEAAWWLLQAVNNGLANITHIQFLTLLFPSRTEARLIIFILGPLAIASSALFFVALTPSRTVLDLGDAIRNVFNSTLLLIFTLSLVMWGFVVNRNHAWRFDGGTAVFGSGSLVLALVSTVGNFIAVKEEGIEWLQHLLWAAVLWQTWLGWWWWVGAGMGIGEVEDLIERAERKQRKAVRRAKRKAATNAQTTGGPGSSASSRARQSSIIANRVRSASSTASAAVANLVLSARRSDNSSASVSGRASGGLGGGGGVDDRRGSRLRFRGRDREGDVEDGLGVDPELELDSGVEMEDLSGARVRARMSHDESGGSGAHAAGEGGNAQSNEGGGNGANRRGSALQNNSTNSTVSETSSTSRTPSLHAPRSLGEFVSFPAMWATVYLRRLRRAHEDATRVRALDQAERRSRVFANEAVGRGMAARGEESGGERSRGGGVNGGGGGGGAGGTGGGTGAGWGLGSFGVREHEEGAKRLREAERRLRAERLLGGEEEEQGEEGRHDGDGAGEGEGERDGDREGRGDREDDWEDVDAGDVDGKGRNGRDETRGGGQGGVGVGVRARNRDDVGTGWSWWGPLREWRLADRSTY